MGMEWGSAEAEEALMAKRPGIVATVGVLAHLVSSGKCPPSVREAARPMLWLVDGRWSEAWGTWVMDEPLVLPCGTGLAVETCGEGTAIGLRGPTGAETCRYIQIDLVREPSDTAARSDWCGGWRRLAEPSGNKPEDAVKAIVVLREMLLKCIGEAE